MKKAETKVGSHYTAKVSGKLTIVRVDEIESGKDRLAVHGAPAHQDEYHVTNLATGRKTTFRSAAKFRVCCDSRSRTANDKAMMEVLGADFSNEPAEDKII